MTAAPQFEYDVAFSFLGADEPIARALGEKVRDRLSPFIFSERQKEIGGSDGEATFARVFERQARTVAVLFRKGWGQTPWTRIEEMAIRNRAHLTGYEFATFIVLERGVELPEWLPKHRLWVDFERLGVAGAAAVIEERVRLAGGDLRSETAVEMAARVERAISTAEAKEALFRSEAGVGAARQEMARLKQELLAGTTAISTSAMPFEFKTARAGSGEVFVVAGSGHSLSAGLEIKYANSLDNSSLGIVLWRGLDPWTPSVRLEEPKRVARREYTFDVDGDLSGWREATNEKRFFSSAQVVDDALRLMLKKVESYRTSREKGR